MSGVDYTAIDTALTFTSSQSMCVNVTITQDSTLEAGEDFTIEINNTNSIPRVTLDPNNVTVVIEGWFRDTYQQLLNLQLPLFFTHRVIH